MNRETSLRRRTTASIGGTVIVAGVAVVALYWLSIARPRAAFLVLAALFLWSIALYQHGHRIRLALTTYATLLLISDDIRGHQRQAFTKWLMGTQAGDAWRLGLDAGGAVQALATSDAGSGIATAAALLWQMRSAPRGGETAPGASGPESRS